MSKVVTRELPATGALELEGLHPLLRRIYATRGITSAEELDLGLTGLLPYRELFDINVAVESLFEALREQKRVLVVGDFDTDGATSTALALRALRAFGLQQIAYLVPSRFEFGYGLTPELVAVAAAQQPQLIITVDNGIANLQGVAKAAEYGIEVLVTDHHLPGAELPQARAIVDPNQPGDQFASKNLAGVGVIFYVLLALRAKLREVNWFEKQQLPEPNMSEYLDLVALGTVADVVPLDRNNRILVQQGIARIRRGRCCSGILALLQVSGCNHQTIVAADLGYRVAPRLNAAGRLIDMKLGIEALLSDDSTQVMEIAAQLHELNQERRLIEGGMQYQVKTELAELERCNNLPQGICLFNAEWHQGVVGLLASRVKDRFHRPTIAFAKVSDTELKGSARSIPGLHIRDLLESMALKTPELMVKFGGHAMAAGLTLQVQNYQQFCEAFDKALRECLNAELLEQKIYSDGELVARDLNLELAELLREGGPWGQGFPEPLFHGRFDILQQRLVGEKHLKLTLAIPGSKWGVGAIAFNVDLSRWPNPRCAMVDIAYRLDINEYQGRRRLQLLIERFLD